MKFGFLEENDIDSLCELLEEAFSLKVSSKAIEKTLGTTTKFLCAKDNDKVVGTVMITIKNDPVKDKKIYYLDYFSVLSNYQNKKIGTNLLLEIERLAKENNIYSINFTSSSKRIYARKIYNNLGYNIKDTDSFYKLI